MSEQTQSNQAQRPPPIEVHGLVNSFGDRKIHDDLDLTVRAGEVMGIVGGSGTGKTVLLNSILGLRQPTAGTIKLFGEDTAAMTRDERDEIEKRWGVLFQHGALFSSLTVLENVSSPLVEHSGLSSSVIRELAEMKIAMVGLGPESHYLKPAELSGGMRKRVGLARALAMSPEVLLYDEPTTGLDPIMSDVINELIIRTRQQQSVTSVIVTHDMITAQKVADRVVMLYPLPRLEPREPQIIFDGSPEDIMKSKDKRVSQFVRGEAGERLQEMERLAISY